MQKFTSALLLLCLITAACSDFKTETKKENPKIQTESLRNFIQTRVSPTEKPERYNIYFDWPKLTENKFMRIRQGREIATVESDQTHFTTEVDHDKIYTYTFEILDDQKRVENSFHLNVKVPTDLVIRESNSQILDDTNISVNRLYINRDTPLITNGHDVQIKAEEIISDHGLIETFQINQKANLDREGRSGGSLKLLAKIARGNLKITLRGEIGGNGSQPGEKPGYGTTGAPPGDGYRECSSIRYSYGDDELRKLNPLICRCERYGPKGGTGEKGEIGYQGNPAKNGGDSGNLNVSIDDGRAFTLDVSTEPGSAGNPGPGGIGQAGGAGGIKKDGVCPGGPGDHGPRGDQGPSGESALAGQNSKYCIYIASEGRNECVNQTSPLPYQFICGELFLDTLQKHTDIHRYWSCHWWNLRDEQA